MSKTRVIKAVFYRRGMQVGEMTGMFSANAADETIKRAMIESYRSWCLACEDPTPLEDADLAGHDPELEAQLTEVFASPERTMNLTEDGREYGNDG